MFILSINTKKLVWRTKKPTEMKVMRQRFCLLWSVIRAALGKTPIAICTCAPPTKRSSGKLSSCWWGWCSPGGCRGLRGHRVTRPFPRHPAGTHPGAHAKRRGTLSNHTVPNNPRQFKSASQKPVKTLGIVGFLAASWVFLQALPPN